MPSPGYCKICDGPHKNEINRRLRRGESLRTIIAWATGKDFKISKPTLIAHKAHVTDPKTTLVKQARANPAIKRATTTEFLEALVDIGFTRAAEDPSSVSMDHALKASAQLEGRKNQGGDARIFIAQIFTQREPVEYIDGSYREIPTLANPEATRVLSEAGPGD